MQLLSYLLRRRSCGFNSHPEQIFVYKLQMIVPYPASLLHENAKNKQTYFRIIM